LINVGEKIFPRDVDAVLLSHPKVLEAETFGAPDAMYGENVQATVILRPNAQATESEVQDYCRSHLSPFEVPERIRIVARFH
jgi:long-chain acyl-CoA synthetase